MNEKTSETNEEVTNTNPEVEDTHEFKVGMILPLASDKEFSFAEIHNAPNMSEFVAYLEGIAAPNKTASDKTNLKIARKRSIKPAEKVTNEFHKWLTPNAPCPCGRKNPNNGKPMKWKKCCRNKIPTTLTIDEIKELNTKVEKQTKENLEKLTESKNEEVQHA